MTRVSGSRRTTHSASSQTFAPFSFLFGHSAYAVALSRTGTSNSKSVGVGFVLRPPPSGRRKPFANSSPQVMTAGFQTGCLQGSLWGQSASRLAGHQLAIEELRVLRLGLPVHLILPIRFDAHAVPGSLEPSRRRGSACRRVGRSRGQRNRQGGSELHDAAPAAGVPDAAARNTRSTRSASPAISCCPDLPFTMARAPT